MRRMLLLLGGVTLALVVAAAAAASRQGTALTLATHHPAVTTSDAVLVHGTIVEPTLGWHESVTVTKYGGAGCSA